MRILIRTSGWAIWARRLGSFGLPLTLVPILMHRAGAIDSTAFEAIEGLAVLVAVLALLCGLSAFVRIWFTGDLGWGLALTGLVLGLVCLAPAFYLAYAYRAWPMANDVTTDTAQPPALVSAGIAAPLLPDHPERLAAAFPGMRDRTYPVGARRVFDLVDQLVADRGWEVLLRHVPQMDEPDGEINAIAVTLFGFRDEVAIRLAAKPDGSTTVSMRSVSLAALNEPGANAQRIQDFLGNLDDRITQLQKDHPAGALENEEDQPPIPAPAPPRGKRR